MPHHSEQSRREFLARSARTAAFAVAAAGGCAAARKSIIPVPAGPAPRPIGPDRAIRLGMVGVGGRGGALLRAALMQEEHRVSVVAIAEPFEEHRRKAAAYIKGEIGETPEFYTGEDDYRRLIARDDIDAVLLATPCYLHARMYLECFAAGKHFYGEKPMCLETAEVEALVQAQEKNPAVIAQIGFQRRASECYQQGIQRIQEGQIGSLISGRAAWNNAWGPLGGKGTKGTGFWFGRRRFSGDWMLEQACHSWDVLSWVTGQLPIAASGVGRRDIFTDVDPGRDVTDFYLAHLEYPCGLLVDFEHNWFCPNKDEGRFTGTFERIAGPKGGLDLTDGKIFPRDPKGQVIELARPKNSGELTILAMAAFLGSARTGRPPISGIHNGRQATLTGLLVRKAVDENRRVLMSEIL